MADYVVETGKGGRYITKEEALEIFRQGEENGFVHTNNNHAKNMRILHQDKIGGGGRNYEFHEDTINRVKNEKKPIEKYVEKKADNWNVKPKAVKNYYIAQAINAVMKSCPAEIDMFCSPEEYISSDDL